MSDLNKIWYDSDGELLDASNCPRPDCYCWVCEGWHEDENNPGHPLPDEGCTKPDCHCKLR